MVKEIPLTQGRFAIVDDEDYEFLMQWKWRYGCDGYAVRSLPRSTGKRKVVMMHRLLNNTPDGMETDHRNGNKLDNRRGNLRTASTSQNQANRRPMKHSSSGAKGVFWKKKDQKWCAQICVGRKRQNLGYFSSKSDAALVYNWAAIRHFGQYACLNTLAELKGEG